MKHLYFLLLLICSFNHVWCNTLYDQLVAVNSNWKTTGCNSATLRQEHTIADEKSLIQAHLNQVILYLSGSQRQLSSSQQSKRQECISILAQYASKGVFPLNTHHAVRQPYFIDDYGTYCAVGYLLHSTGYTAVAQRIHNEINYAYIKEIPTSYISEWADEYGFAIDELALIQPTYSPHVECANDTFFIGFNSSTVCPMLKNDVIVSYSPNCQIVIPPVINIVVPPLHGQTSVTFLPTDTFVTYTPNVNYTGFDSLKYEVIYGNLDDFFCQGKTDTATIYFHVLSAQGTYVTILPGDANYDNEISGIDVIKTVQHFGELGPIRNPDLGNCVLNYSVPWGNDVWQDDVAASDMNNDGLISTADIQNLPDCAFPTTFRRNFSNDFFSWWIKVLPYDTVITTGNIMKFRFVIHDSLGHMLPLKAISFSLFRTNYVSPNWLLLHPICSPVNSSGSSSVINYTKYMEYSAPYQSFTKVATWCTLVGNSTTTISSDTFEVTTDMINDDLAPGQLVYMNINSIFALDVDNNIIAAKGTGVRFRTGQQTDVNEVSSIAATVFPNPTSSAFTLTLSSQPAPNTLVLLHDNFGRLIKQEEITSIAQQISVADLTNGLYTYTITQSGVRQATGKLIVNK